MDERERGEKQPSPIAKQIEELLSTEDTWQIYLRQQISKRVKESYQWQIRRKIEREFELAQSQRELEREEQLAQLRERVALGESTGNPDFNIVFVLTGKAEPELVAKVRTLRERVNQALKEEENPLLLEIHFLKGEAKVLSLTQISQPGLSLWTHEQLGHNLGFSATGYASWSEVKIGEDYCSVSTDYVKTPFHLDALDLRETYPEISSEEAISKTGQEKGSLSIILLGEEIKFFLQEHPEFQARVSSLHTVLSQNSNQKITPLELPSTSS